MALYVALIAVVLVAVAALTVDLGNAWQRGRAVQTQVDASAISAGHLLPMTSENVADIAAEAARYLDRNRVPGQEPVVGPLLLDGDLRNGEVRFYDRGGAPCAENCPRMTLTAPEARVDFALAGAIGMSRTDVQRSATVLVVSELPPEEKLIPIWLPAGCGYGPVDGDTTQGGTQSPVAAPSAGPGPSGGGSGSGSASPSAEPTPSPAPTATPTPTPAPTVPIEPRGSHTLSGLDPINTSQDGTVTITGYRIDGLPNNTAKATVRLVAPDRSRFVDYAASTSVPKGWMAVPPFDVGPEVTGTPGDWTAYAIVQANGSNKPQQYSANNLVLSVAAGPTPTPTHGPTEPSGPDPSATPTTPSPSPTPSPTNVPVGCVGQDRGNFGQLYSPRVETTNKNEALARNFALGIDHVLMPFDTGRYQAEKECARANGSGAIAGARLDDVSRDGNNCIIGDTGNDGPRIFDGLISGVDVGSTHHPGRLDVANGPAACPGRPRLEVRGVVLNNDVLSCFLRNGATLQDIAEESGVGPAMLDPSVLRSPRFVWLPVVLATDRAQKGFQPIIDFVPAFITDETQLSPATEDNGLQVDGNSVKVIRLFAFNKDALPVDEGSPDSDYVETLDRPIVRLIG